MKHFSLVLFFFSFMLTSCSKREEKIPADIISKDKMVQVMVDIHIAESRSQIGVPFNDIKTQKQSYYKFVFEKHKISYTLLKKSFDYYTARPEIFSKIYDEVITELSKRQAEKGGSKKPQ